MLHLCHGKAMHKSGLRLQVCVFMCICQTVLALLMHRPWECVFGRKDWLGIYERWIEAGVKSGARAGDRDALLCFSCPDRSLLGQALSRWKVKVTRPYKCLFDLYFSCEVRNCGLWTTSASHAFGCDRTVCWSHLSSFYRVTGVQVFVHYISLVKTKVVQSKMKILSFCSPSCHFKPLWVSFSWRTQMMMLGALFHRKENKRDKFSRSLNWHKTPWKKVWMSEVWMMLSVDDSFVWKAIIHTSRNVTPYSVIVSI